MSKNLALEKEILEQKRKDILSEVEELIESKNMDGVVKYLQDKFANIDTTSIDAVVLGCTHYPFIKKEILIALDRDVHFYDGGEGVARRLKYVLHDKDISATRKEQGMISVYSSGDEMYNNFLKSYIEI